MAAITLSAAAKKIAAALASDEKGRKAIWYAIGIAIFILLIPAIVIFCLFGGMADAEIDLNEMMNYEEIMDKGMDNQKLGEMVEKIETVFAGYELKSGDIRKAQIITVFLLKDKITEPDFLNSLAGCFLYANEDESVYDRIEDEFGIRISEKDRGRLDFVYGRSPGR